MTSEGCPKRDLPENVGQMVDRRVRHPAIYARRIRPYRSSASVMLESGGHGSLGMWTVYLGPGRCQAPVKVPMRTRTKGTRRRHAYALRFQTFTARAHRMLRKLRPIVDRAG